MGKSPLWSSSPELEDDLLDALEAIKTTGCFLTSRSLISGINPGLHVSGVGQVALPLSPNAAKSIAAACHASPYGKGGETLVDDSVRRTWELNVDQFSFHNPAWRYQTGLILRDVVAKLGLDADPSEVQADPYKLLLYEEGAFFLPHQDSEKADGMFGTLVISLPSKHEGGDVIASHRNESRTYVSSTDSEYNFSYAAWYSDVRHEIRPVTSGYRLVLTYNLIHRPSATALKGRDGLAEQLGNCLTSWANRWDQKASDLKADSWPESSWFSRTKEDSCRPFLVYLLDYEYTPVELGFTRLKGADRARVAELQKACDACGFRVFLTNVEKQVSGPVDSHGYKHYGNRGRLRELDVIIYSSLRISNVVGVDGRTIIRELDIPEPLIINHDFSEAEPDEEDFEGFTGNEGAEATRYYHRAGVLIVPNAFYHAFMLHAIDTGRTYASVYLAYLQSRFRSSPHDETAHSQLLQVCRKLAGHSDDALCVKVATILFDHRDWVGFRKCLQMGLPVPGSMVGTAIYQHGLAEFEPILDDLWELHGKDHFDSVSLLSDIFNSYASRCSVAGTPVSAEVVQWRKNTLYMLFCQILQRPDLTAESALSLVAELRVISDLDILIKITPLLVSKASNTLFTVKLITALYDGFDDVNQSDRVKIKATYETIFAAVAREVHLLHIVQGPALCTYRPHGFKPNESSQPGLIAYTLVKVIRQSHSMGLDVSMLMESIQTQVHLYPDQKASTLLTEFSRPFIKCLSELMTSKPDLARIVVPNQNAPNVITTLLETYLLYHVQTPPEPPGNWKQTLPTSSFCFDALRCRDCDALREFLEDPNVQSVQFRMAGDRRKHLQSKLDDTFLCETIRGPSPFTLEITKTTKKYQDEVREWNERASEATRNIQDIIRACSLTTVLGSDACDKLLGKVLKAPRPPVLSGSDLGLADLGQTSQVQVPYPGAYAPLPAAPSSCSGLNSTQEHPEQTQSLLGSSLSVTVPRKRSFVDLTE
ncbi:hypothetical protein BJX99DRAFT_18616 [Aspergillus californicus]